MQHTKREGERERLHWQSQLQLQLESDSDLEADSEWASWTWLGLARLGVWLCLACGGKFHCHASFSINLLATAGQADKSNEPPQAAGSVCRMPLLGIATATPTSSSHFFVDFILIYEDRFIWLPLLLHASHRSAAMSKFIADAR